MVDLAQPGREAAAVKAAVREAAVREAAPAGTCRHCGCHGEACTLANGDKCGWLDESCTACNAGPCAAAEMRRKAQDEARAQGAPKRERQYPRGWGYGAIRADLRRKDARRRRGKG